MTEPPVTDDALDALIVAAFEADAPPPPASATLVAIAVARPQERPAPAWLAPKPARIGWAAAGVLALVLGCAAGAASRIAAVPNDLDAAFGVAQSAAEPAAGEINAG